MYASLPPSPHSFSSWSPPLYTCAIWWAATDLGVGWGGYAKLRLGTCCISRSNEFSAQYRYIWFSVSYYTLFSNEGRLSGSWTFFFLCIYWYIICFWKNSNVKKIAMFFQVPLSPENKARDVIVSFRLGKKGVIKITCRKIRI